jgi:hypothetical protein
MFMKKAALVLIIFSALCGLSLPEAHANEFGTLIIELESSINESGIPRPGPDEGTRGWRRFGRA